jgi:hypothetical protein
MRDLSSKLEMQHAYIKYVAFHFLDNLLNNGLE